MLTGAVVWWCGGAALPRRGPAEPRLCKEVKTGLPNSAAHDPSASSGFW